MPVARLVAPILCTLVFVAGCSQTPTAPSSAAPAATPFAAAPSAPAASTASDTTPASPSITVAPPRALGLVRFVAFGDSITWGAHSAFDARMLFAAANGGYPERAEAILNTTHAPQRFTVMNLGEPGELAVNALTRFRTMLTARKPECVLLLEGINDLSNGISPTSVASAIRQMLDVAAASAVPVLVATMYPTYEVVDPDGNLRPNGATAVPVFNAQIRQIVAGRLNVHLVDLEPIMRDRSLVGNDGIHATDAGFDVMAAAFVATIERVFTVRGSFQ
jgi:lysophospholipase L1-like esterase